MKHDAFDGLVRYKSAMAQANLMLQKGLISSEELSEIEIKMCEIYGINFGSLYRDINWINP